MKKILILLLLLCVVVTASANAPLVVDNGELLSEQEQLKLEQQLEDIQADLGIDVVILTVKSLDGEIAMDFADDYYDYRGYRPNGVLLLVDIGGRNWWISTSGTCIDPIDAKAMGMLFVPYMSEGAYYSAFSLFAKAVQTQMENPHVSGDFYMDMQGNVHIQPKPTHWYDGLWQSLLIGGVIGLIAVGVMAAKMKSVRSKGGAADYIKEGSLHMTREEDRYLYQTLTRRAKPKNNGSTHRGSSGRSHGGGGGRF